MSSERDPAPEESSPSPCRYTEYREGEGSEDLPATGDGSEGLERAVWDALYGVEDPEMPVSIVDLGLIYGVDVADPAADAGDDPDARTEGVHVTVDMTLTYTGCPAREMLLRDVEESVAAVDGVADAAVRLVWSPEWSLEMVTEQGRADLKEFGLSV